MPPLALDHRVIQRGGVEQGARPVDRWDAAAAGDTITIHCWRVKSRPTGWAGPSGHYGIPAAGSRFEMWLRRTDEGNWEPLQPNGINLIDGPAIDFDSLPSSGVASYLPVTSGGVVPECRGMKRKMSLTTGLST